MEEFTLSLALLDYLPVIFFGIAIINVGIKLNSVLFVVGAALSLIAGVSKATWKLILGVSKKDIAILNKYFLPVQFTGFGIMIIALIINYQKLNFSALFETPRMIFIILWAVFMGIMVWYRKNRFKKYDAKSNWTAEIINTLGQLSLMISTLL